MDINPRRKKAVNDVSKQRERVRGVLNYKASSFIKIVTCIYQFSYSYVLSIPLCAILLK
jgi:hypothetical protein